MQNHKSQTFPDLQKQWNYIALCNGRKLKTSMVKLKELNDNPPLKKLSKAFKKKMLNFSNYYWSQTIK